MMDVQQMRALSVGDRLSMGMKPSYDFAASIECTSLIPVDRCNERDSCDRRNSAPGLLCDFTEDTSYHMQSSKAEGE